MLSYLKLSNHKSWLGWVTIIIGGMLLTLLFSPLTGTRNYEQVPTEIKLAGAHRLNPSYKILAVKIRTAYFLRISRSSNTNFLVQIKRRMTSALNSNQKFISEFEKIGSLLLTPYAPRIFLEAALRIRG